MQCPKFRAATGKNSCQKRVCSHCVVSVLWLFILFVFCTISTHLKKIFFRSHRLSVSSREASGPSEKRDQGILTENILYFVQIDNRNIFNRQ